MIASVTIINGLTAFSRARFLPVNGHVVARVGQKVNPETVLAEATVAPHIEVLDARPVFSGIPRERMQSMIRREVGEKVDKDDIIIETGGRINRVLRATASGVIRSISANQVLIQVKKKPYRLRVAYKGVISEIIENRGVMLQMQGSLAQGVWGNGRHATGKLIAATFDPRMPLQPDDMRGECLDAIVLAGRCRDADSLVRAQTLPIRGLILGSLSSHLIPLAYKMPFPILVTSGFSPSGMDENCFRLLSSNKGRTVSVVALPWDRDQGVRPEAFIHLESTKVRTILEMIEYRKGQTVRVNTLPYMPQVGTIANIHPEPVLLPNGLSARAADVALKNGQQILVPLNNLDVLE
jgi:hypothetical protein